MTPSAACLALIKRCEGEKLNAYRDTGGVLTIGVGHTGPDVAASEQITDAQAMALLQGDLAKAAADVTRLAAPCSQQQFDALTSLTFNIGAGQLSASTLLHLHRAGDHTAAAAEFPKWCHDNGVIEPGLVKRRAYETLLYLGEPVA